MSLNEYSRIKFEDLRKGRRGGEILIPKSVNNDQKSIWALEHRFVDSFRLWLLNFSRKVFRRKIPENFVHYNIVFELTVETHFYLRPLFLLPKKKKNVKKPHRQVLPEKRKKVDDIVKPENFSKKDETQEKEKFFHQPFYLLSDVLSLLIFIYLFPSNLWRTIQKLKVCRHFYSPSNLKYGFRSRTKNFLLIVIKGLLLTVLPYTDNIPYLRNYIIEGY